MASSSGGAWGAQQEMQAPKGVGCRRWGAQTQRAYADCVRQITPDRGLPEEPPSSREATGARCRPAQRLRRGRGAVSCACPAEDGGAGSLEGAKVAKARAAVARSCIGCGVRVCRAHPPPAASARALSVVGKTQ